MSINSISVAIGRIGVATPHSRIAVYRPTDDELSDFLSFRAKKKPYKGGIVKTCFADTSAGVEKNDCLIGVYHCDSLAQDELMQALNDEAVFL